MSKEVDKAKKLAEGLDDFQLLKSETIKELGDSELLLICILKLGPIEKEYLVNDIVNKMRRLGVIEIENDKVKLKNENVVFMI